MNDKVKTALRIVAESRPKMSLKTAPERAELEEQARADIDRAILKHMKNLKRYDPVEYYDQGGSGLGQMREATDGDYFRADEVTLEIERLTAALTLFAKAHDGLLDVQHNYIEKLTVERDEILETLLPK